MELLIASGLMMLMTGLFLAITLGATRIARNVDTGTGIFSEARQGFELLNDDIQRSSGILTQFPPTGAATHSSNGTNTIILRIPRLNAQGDAVAGSWDIVIYRLVPVTGETGPFHLERLRASLVGGAPTPVIREQVVARSIANMSFRYIATDTFWGNSTAREFTLRLTPDANTPEHRNTIMVGGRDRASDGNATFVGNRVRFTFPPRNGVAVDVIYNADPAVRIGVDGLNAANSVHTVMRIRTRGNNASHVVSGRTVELSSRAIVRN